MSINELLTCAMGNLKRCTLSPKGKKRGNYYVLSLADRAEVGKYASQHSTPQTIA